MRHAMPSWSHVALAHVCRRAPAKSVSKDVREGILFSPFLSLNHRLCRFRFPYHPVL